MDKMKIRFDPTDNTLQVWFASPQAMSHLSPIEEDTPGDFHLIKNDQGQVIGLECQLYHIPAGQLQIDFETAPLLPKNRRK